MTFDLLSLAAEFGLSAYAGNLKKYSRQSTALIPVSGGSQLRSHLGGSPAVPSGYQWPANKEGAPLSFLLQVFLSEAPIRTSKGKMIDSGSLLVFYDSHNEPNGLQPDHDAGFRLVYFGESELLQLVSVPNGTQVFSHANIEMENFLTFPEIYSVEINDLELDRSHMQNYVEFRHESLTRQIHHYWQCHQMLGFPNEIQNESTVRCELVSRGRDFNSDTSELEIDDQVLEGARDWILLFQINSESRPDGFEWTRDGSIYVYIKNQHLEGLKFYNSWFLLQYS